MNVSNKPNGTVPPTPDELGEDGFRSKVAVYTEFADKMIRAVYGKNKYSHSSSITLFDDLVGPSLEAFALLLYKNGYANWVWTCNNACSTSEGEDTDMEERPGYKYTKRTGDFTSRNGGWSKVGMTSYNDLYRKVKEDRTLDDGSFAKAYREHRASMSGKKRKRRLIDGGPCEQVIASDDLDLLWSAGHPTDTAAV
jgi:hypothetical protein